eukprot:14206235-Alexandrium_andersonii.AAC.1
MDCWMDLANICHGSEQPQSRRTLWLKLDTRARPSQTQPEEVAASACPTGRLAPCAARSRRES